MPVKWTKPKKVEKLNVEKLKSSKPFNPSTVKPFNSAKRKKEAK